MPWLNIRPYVHIEGSGYNERNEPSVGSSDSGMWISLKQKEAESGQGKTMS